MEVTDLGTLYQSLETLTFDEMRNCLSSAVQRTGVEVGVLNGAFVYVGSWNRLQNVLEQYNCVGMKQPAGWHVTVDVQS